MLKNLLDNLHPATNKDPQSLNALQINGTGTAVIKNNNLQIIGSNVPPLNLRTYTLGSLTTAINGISGYSATNFQLSNLSACVLLDGTYSLPATIPMFSSFLWQFLKPVALAMADALGAEHAALLEEVMNTSDGPWLDLFGELFNVTRENGEPDELYAIRVFNLSLGNRVNNIAIQKALQDLQYETTVDDSGPATFDVNVTLPATPPQGFYYDTGQIGDIVNLLKAAGTIANIVLQGAINGDKLALKDSVTTNTYFPNDYVYPGWTCSLLGILYVIPSGGWVWGTGEYLGKPVGTQWSSLSGPWSNYNGQWGGL